ncbi:MAG: glycosyltransferase family 1 protein [Chloroflexota bacterium]
MRIGIDVTSALTQGGGIGRYTRELVHALALTEFNSSFDIHLFSARTKAPSPVPNPLPNHPQMVHRPARLSEKWLYRLWYRLKLPLPVQTFTGPIDLYHSPDFVLPPISGETPTLLTIHDLSFIHYPETFTPQLIRFLNRVVPESVGKASHILADSIATQRDLIELWQVPDEKITVLYSGVNETFRPITDKVALKRAREKYNLGQAPYVLTLGTVQPRKNYRMLIEAFAPIAKTHDHNLIIVGGKGWLFEEILNEVKVQGLEGRVIFTGFVDDIDLPTIYSAATLFAFPSIYEGFGLPILESMACGVPVINSNASCLPEVAGKATIQLDPTDQNAWTEALEMLLKDPVQRAQMVAEGYIQAQHFSWKKSAQQLLEVYSQLLL